MQRFVDYSIGRNNNLDTDMPAYDMLVADLEILRKGNKKRLIRVVSGKEACGVWKWVTGSLPFILLY